MTRQTLIPTLVGLFAILGPSLTGCAQFQQGWNEGVNQANYTDEMKGNFLSACIKAAEVNNSAEFSKKYCECTYDRVSSTVPVEEYVKYDTGESIKPETRSAFKVAVSQCGGDPSQL